MPRTYPIVLAHGIAPFDTVLRPFLAEPDGPDDRLHYFRKIRSTLIAEGFDVHHSRVAFSAGVTVRARELRANVLAVLERTGAAKLHVVAHSMGGLDARHMLFDHRDEGLAARVASVSTIATPHLGTSFADWGMRAGGALVAMLNALGLGSLDGFRDLQTGPCRAFNERAAAFERDCGVRFQTFAGAQDRRFVFPPLQLSWKVIRDAEGDNDGLVSVTSARWRDECFQGPVWDADHLNQIGWWEPNDRQPRDELEARIQAAYVRIAEGLAAADPL